MNKQARSRKFTAKQSARLGAYLAAGLGAAATSTTDAAIVNINIGPSGFNIGGVNAGLANNSRIYLYTFPFPGGGYLTVNRNFDYNGTASGAMTGLVGGGGLDFAFITNDPASPRNFALNATIDSSVFINGATRNSLFKDDFFGGAFVFTSPDFGPDSFMGFETSQGNFGWLEVTWDSNTSQFEILSGAYESEAGVAILAGQSAGPAAVPEPGTWAAAALLAGGAAFMRWRKRRDEAQKEAA